MIYRSLAEDIFIYEDAIAELRKKDLQTAMICSVASARVLEEQYPEGVKIEGPNELIFMRGDAGNVGWLIRWTTSAERYATDWQQQVWFRVLVFSTCERTCLELGIDLLLLPVTAGCACREISCCYPSHLISTMRMDTTKVCYGQFWSKGVLLMLLTSFIASHMLHLERFWMRS